jgi:F0F1-type ATP synthase membrane subunit c/vacuolar-type H+-ATPase subunit K
MNEGTKDALMDVGLTIGVPLTMYGVGKGIGWIGNKFSSKAAQAVDGAIPTTYTANRKLFTWENPWGWVSTQG